MVGRIVAFAICLALTGCARLAAAGPAAPLAHGDQFEQVCGVCHLARGEGVPGAFPPLGERLLGWAATDPGRHYLVSVITRGLFGPIDVEGVQYVGAMPPLSQLSDADTAGLLNYVLQDLLGAADDQLFTTEEVMAIRDLKLSEPSRSLRPAP